MFTTVSLRIKATLTAVAVMVGALVAFTTAQPAHAVTLSNGTVLPSSAFVMIDANGQPARWDPCAPMYWKLYKRGLPTGGYSALVYAFRQLRATTGLNFVYAGAATLSEWSTPPARTIVIGFTSLLPKTRAGIARNTFVGGENNSLVILSAQVKINRMVANRADAPFPEMVPVVLHELGHAVGMGHSNSIREVMNRYVVPVYKYQRGDLPKLRAVGAGNGCQALPA